MPSAQNRQDLTQKKDHKTVAILMFIRWGDWMAHEQGLCSRRGGMLSGKLSAKWSGRLSVDVRDIHGGEGRRMWI